MPIYTYACKKCNIKKQILCSIKELDLKSKKCDVCQGDLGRVFKAPNSEFSKDVDQAKIEAKQWANKMKDKIANGDMKTIEDVYGSQLNKLKE
jgi:putative FmdB family regulatory protein